MTVYLYALADGPGDLSDITGIAAEPLLLLTVDTLTAVAGAIAAPPSPTADALAAQDRIVRTLHARAAALLPMRFGASFASHDAVAAAITPRAAVLRDRLRTVRGCDQMTVRVTRAADAARAEGQDVAAASERQRVEGGPGRTYLRARAALARPQEIAPLLEAVAHLQRGAHTDRGKTAGVIASVYHLITRGHDAEYRAALEHAASGQPELRVRITGPGPCYAFA